MPSIQLKALSLATPDGRDLFQNLDLTLGPVRTGLVGRNGTGKTTLLRAILGEIAPKSGCIAVDGRLGVLRQSVQVGHANVADALGIVDDLSRLDRIKSGAPGPDDVERADWTLVARIRQSLAAVGLPDLALDRALSTLSGGQRTRLSLAALLLDQPDFLLLDESTNNLDADGRATVADLLRNWKHGAVVVSHDRELLRGMDQILELTSVGVKLYGGNWDDYEAHRAHDLAAAEHDLGVARRQLSDVARKVRDRNERKAHADARGKRAAARGGQPAIIAGAMKRRAEQTSGPSCGLPTGSSTKHQPTSPRPWPGSKSCSPSPSLWSHLALLQVVL
jgi:ATPase subunit of ABC transporter with duplicated ATPase domains